jgi:hypothetical protein
VATQDPDRQRALVVPDKATRVHNFHELTIEALAELIGAAGLQHPRDITPEHITVRNSSGLAVPLSNTLPTVAEGALLSEEGTELWPEPFHSDWPVAQTHSFERRARPRK